MAERATRSGRTPRKPTNPGFVETPGRRKYTRRRSVVADRDESPTPDSRNMLDDMTERLQNGKRLNGNAHANGFPSEYDSDTAYERTNGHVNESGNGHANGHSNGHANGHANGSAKDQTAEAATKAEKEQLKKLDNPAIDTSEQVEFGGSFGMLAMMTGFPALMYYMWIGATFYDGKFPTPAVNESWTEFVKHLVFLVRTEAYPSNRAWSIYWYFGLVQMAFYMLLPGVYRKGKPLPHLDGKQLDYYCSAMWSFYTTIVGVLALHFTGLFKLYTLIDEFGPLMSVAIISGFLCSFIAYTSALARGAQIRMTGYPVMDFFLGAELNPRLFGILDFKMFLEVRIPWFILFGLAVGACLKQWDQYGFVSGEALFLLFATWLYANACAKGEHMIITTWDMYYEKLGFMLIFWNMAGVPLSYCHAILYVANHHPEEYHWPPAFIAGLAIAYCGVYYVWDTCNSQKNQFRQEERGIVEERKTFPYFKYGRIANPVTIPTQHGNKILCDGWYGKARKVHYTCDVFFALSWGLITGFKSPFPWFYPFFFCAMIIHRASRDIAKCHERYGEAWEEYTRRVPYLFIPYVF